jgi:hypothetical protein
MAGQTNLITSFVRRISKYFNSATFVWPRPKRAIPGTNHIDNPADFDSRTIYRGETIVDFDAGALYTQDGGEIIQPNTQPSIVEGLRVVTPSVVGAAGGGTLWVSVETGAGRILGKNYYHEPASGLADGDIQISPNPSPPPKARIDIIALKSDYPNPAPTSIVGTFGVDSTEYAAGLTAIAGPTYNAGKAITFLGTYSGTGTTISIDPQQGIGSGAIVIGDAIVGPGIGVASGVTAITLAGGIITAIDVTVPPSAAYTNVTYAVSTASGVNYAFQADSTSGSNVLTNVYPQPALNELVFAPGIPPGTLTTNVATAGQVTLSNSATLTTTGTIYQIGDVADHLIYDTTSLWPILDDEHLFLGLVFVPSNYTAGSPANILRPWSWSQIWQTYDMPNHTPKNLLQDYRSQITKYTTDTSYVSGQMVIDEQSHLWHQVIRNHYSSDLATSLSNGDIMTLIGIQGASGPTGPTGVGSPYQYNGTTPSAIEPILGTNTASGLYSNIGGGFGNTAIGDHSSIGSGVDNTASGTASFIGAGLCNTASGLYSFIGSGQYNYTSSNFSTVVGGSGNTGSGIGAFVGGGINNSAAGNNSFIGGGTDNSVSSRRTTIVGGYGNTITSAGCSSFIGGGEGNTASNTFSTIGGGCNNTISSSNAFIGGGEGNTATGKYAVIGGGRYNTSLGSNASIGGGYGNTATGNFSTVAGGCLNTAIDVFSTIVGGYGNTASGTGTFVGGGTFNTANATHSVVVGGSGNTVSATGSFVGGGTLNTASGNCATISGGRGNTASSNVATIGGGSGNTVSGNCATISGGRQNTASGSISFIGGGVSNTASGTYSTVGGGQGNTASNVCATVGGGICNVASGTGAFIGGGNFNTASCFQSVVVGGSANSSSNTASFVGGGICNVASAKGSFIGGGVCNTASGQYALIVNGVGNTASGGCAVIVGGVSNIASGNNSAILGGSCNDSCGFTGAMIVGIGLTAHAECTTFVNRLNIRDIPTSSAGLTAGDVWNNLGVLNIV